MKIQHYIITALLTYVFFLLLLTPAASIVSRIELPRSLQLNGISGSIWSGQIDQVLFRQQSLSNLEWSVHPLSLITGSISSDIKTDIFQNTVNGVIDYSLISKQLNLTDIKSRINASDLQQQLQLPFGDLDGVISLSADEVIIEKGKLPNITGVLSWRNAKLTLTSAMNLGDLFIRVAPGENGGLTGDISNLRGQLTVKGKLTVSDKQIYSLNLTLKPRANAPEELLSLLRLMAPAKKGEHIISRSGHLRQLGIKL